ncbi:MAG TPA: organoarsenical effux MFS transporter ArsJ [Planctomycetes bacterium]|nr:organoarsenical effux MFS transporter ArsJ [Planctomycetota bacterium]HIL36325.1 organoarsenical effux MFS transporter ArsJ [Planctomycetota bacterium]
MDKPSRNLRDYLIVTAAYWAFTLSDSALRMIILLELHSRGMSPLELATLFLFYEAAGVVTNLGGGWIGARFGLRTTLLTGLALQALVLGILTGPGAWLRVSSLITAQAASGVAKDLTKMSAKSYVRMVVPSEEAGKLMRWVAILTGSKNTLKGVGFFLGAILLFYLDYQWACGFLLIGILTALIATALSLPAAQNHSSSKVKIKHLISNDPRINWLSAARVFLFGSRDAWFVVALPVYLATHGGWSHIAIGAFLALWVTGYGLAQISAPNWVGGASKGNTRPPGPNQLGIWTWTLTLPMIALCSALYLDAPPGPVLVIALAIFGVIFASASTIHSYLIVQYAKQDEVSLRVGFYYAANALGRLMGTLLSGWVYQSAGLGLNGLLACLLTSTLLVILATLATTALRRVDAAR